MTIVLDTPDDRTLRSLTWKEFCDHRADQRRAMHDGDWVAYRLHHRRCKELATLLLVLDVNTFGRLSDRDFTWLARRETI
jgi:hypothetical protein